MRNTPRRSGDLQEAGVIPRAGWTALDVTLTADGARTTAPRSTRGPGDTEVETRAGRLGRERVPLTREGGWTQTLAGEPESLPGHPAPSRETGAGPAPLLEVGARTNGDGYRDGDGIGEPGDPMYTLQARKQHGVAHTLTGEGHDASEDGTGRGTPIVMASGQANAEIAEDASPTLNLNRDGAPIAFVKGRRAQSKDDPETWDERPVTPTLDAGGPAARTGTIAFQCHGSNVGEMGTLRASNGSVPFLGDAVPRRLTPRECERLQGFPDDWTRYRADGSEVSDSARYRMLGNAVAVPCSEWIGRRIMEAA